MAIQIRRGTDSQWESNKTNIVAGEPAVTTDTERLFVGTGSGTYAEFPSVNNVADIIYPVGSIYMSVNNTNPTLLFGGTWEQIQDTFLLSAGSTYSAGATGGEATHALTESEMPAHNHTVSPRYNWGATNKNVLYANGAVVNAASNVGTGYASIDTGIDTRTTSTRGSGQAFNNMPPYLVVYMWKRTA